MRFVSSTANQSNKTVSILKHYTLPVGQELTVCTISTCSIRMSQPLEPLLDFAVLNPCVTCHQTQIILERVVNLPINYLVTESFFFS